MLACRPAPPWRRTWTSRIADLRHGIGARPPPRAGRGYAAPWRGLGRLDVRRRPSTTTWWARATTGRLPAKCLMRTLQETSIRPRWRSAPSRSALHPASFTQSRDRRRLVAVELDGQPPARAADGVSAAAKSIFGPQNAASARPILIHSNYLVRGASAHACQRSPRLPVRCRVPPPWPNRGTTGRGTR